ncbi:MAG: DUF2095 family protein [Candidatus Bathyarchaeota archaeon]|nr:MAG: DUF2095 family protein [Candidatus Bathyarchaeota archaeon]
MEKDRFKKLFPNLAKEIEGEGSKIRIDQNDASSRNDRIWSGYDPDIVDFLRRCDDDDQAEEVISYMEDREEITPERAAELRRQFREHGLGSFGPKKEDGYYHKNR